MSEHKLSGEDIADEIRNHRIAKDVLNGIIPFLYQEYNDYLWVMYGLTGECDEVISRSLVRAINAGYEPCDSRYYSDIAKMPEIKEYSFGNYIMYKGLMLCERNKHQGLSGVLDSEPVMKKSSIYENIKHTIRKYAYKIRNITKYRIRWSIWITEKEIDID